MLVVRITSIQLDDIAHGRGSCDYLPPEVVREVQVIVFWFENASGDADPNPFASTKDEGGTKSFDLPGTYCLPYDWRDGVITLGDPMCM